MHRVLVQRFPLAALGGAIAMLLTGCEMPTASLSQGPAAKSPHAVAAAPNAGAATTTSPTSPSAGAPTGASGTSPVVSRPATVGDAVGVTVPSPSTVFQPPAPGLPGTAPPATPGGSSNSGSRVQVQLSAGVALAQTLPDGTGMLLGVQYRFSGRRDQSTRYFWVITCQKGRGLRQEVQLAKDEDELHAVARGMLPEVGPFQCHLEAQARGTSQPTVISNTARMVSDNVPR